MKCQVGGVEREVDFLDSEPVSTVNPSNAKVVSTTADDSW